MDYVPQSEQGTGSQTSKRRILLSYAFDYLVLIVLFFAVSALNFVTPFNQHFALQNYTLQYPYAVHERVSSTLLYICSLLIPGAIIALWSLAIDAFLEGRGAKEEGRQKEPYKKGIWELNSGILGLLLANTAAYVITGILKNATGKPRPDLIDRCQPDIPSDQFVSPVYGLSNSTICTQADMSILHDGFRSFPSGHSASSFSGLFYLSLFLAGKLHFLDHRGEVWKSFVVLVPTLSAALIAISRIMDARHHPFDVISGSVLGVICAFVAYRQYFPPVTAFEHLGRAYTARRRGPHDVHPVSRSSHQHNPSFHFEPAKNSLQSTSYHKHSDSHQYSFVNHPASPSPQPSSGLHSPQQSLGLQRSQSQALSAEPLRQQPFPPPLSQRDSLGGYRQSSPVGPLDAPGGYGHTENAWHQGGPIGSKFSKSPPADEEMSPVEMNSMPSPKRRRFLQDQKATEERRTNKAEDWEQGARADKGFEIGRHSFEEDDESLVHPAFRRQR